MAMTKTDFFDKLSKGARWDVGVSIARGNPLPLEKTSLGNLKHRKVIFYI